ncbi:hypothetical protein SEA_DOGGS_31 [Gordonia phage Doggs]|nr:hypothetical protein SEA_DOGGS_31 [Gordonia phage Doggs]
MAAFRADINYATDCAGRTLCMVDASLPDWIAAAGSAIGALATAAAAFASWRAASTSAVAAKRATEALAYHHRPTVMVSVVRSQDSTATVQVTTYIDPSGPPNHQGFDQWKARWASKDGRTGVAHADTPIGSLRIPVPIEPNAFLALSISCRDVSNDVRWFVEIPQPHLRENYESQWPMHIESNRRAEG